MAASTEAAERARIAPRRELAGLLDTAEPEVLSGLLENPRFDEDLLCRLLERNDLPGRLLERIPKKPAWIKSYRVRFHLARHPNTPRLVAMAALRHLYLFDLVQVSLLPSVPAEIRRLAEDLILSRLGQIPLGQKLTLARRGPARVLGQLLAEGLTQVIPLALDNAFLTEAQILRVLAHSDVPGVVAALASHKKWSHSIDVRIALIRHPLTPLVRVMAFLPDVPLHHLRDLARLTTLRPDLRKYLEHEVSCRLARRRLE